MTEAEKKLWFYIKDRSKGISFRRQHIIGDYIVDFVCLKKKLVIEVDGGYHFSEEQMTEDKIRTDALQRMGYTVLRFTNEQIFFDIDSVLSTIYNFNIITNT